MSRLKILCGIVVACFLAGVANYSLRTGGHRKPPIATPPATYIPRIDPTRPTLVIVEEWSPDGLSEMEIRDQWAIGDLLELFPDLSPGNAVTPEEDRFTMLKFICPDANSNREVVVIGQGDQETWLRGPHRVSLNGELQIALDMIPIQLVVYPGLRESPISNDTAEALLALNRERYLAVALRAEKSQNDRLREMALRTVERLMLHGTWADIPYFKDHFRSFDSLPQAGKRSPREAANADAICKWAVEVLSDNTRYRRNTLRLLVPKLADQAMIDHIAEKYEQAPLANVAGDWLECLQVYYGLPQLYQAGGMCGNSSAAEKQRFYQEEMKRRSQAKAEILRWHKEQHACTRPEQILAAVHVWENLGAVPVRYPKGDYAGGSLRYFEPLLLLGPEVVPALEQELFRPGMDLHTRGLLEFAHAYITGGSNPQLLQELWQGDDLTRRIACDIVIATNDKSHLNILTNLVCGKIEGEEALALHEKAKETLVRVHRYR